MCLLECVALGVGRSSMGCWQYYREQDGYFGEKKLEQMFPALERPICVFQSLV